ncbi:alpha-tocopherol transfer protein-like [Copidosoma floridanum]|uniref:alpha-tocopherol transfer protein-like n=1 Tax=Copidosoma floridanum TaxID=29053 RepID=UPI0006C99AA8|nr:alpha-tocopherol transfer protein-like [Copidosoma floridanum]
MDTLKKIPIEEEYKRNPQLREDDIQHLKDWYKKQPHFPNYIDENALIMFLHSNYFRLEPTKNTIESFLTTRTHIPECFSNRDPIGSKDIRNIMKTILAIPLENKTPEGYGVIYARLIDYDPDRYVFYDAMKLYNMISELWLLQAGTMPGQVLVTDISGVQMGHALRIPPMAVKKFVYYLQESVPLRIKSLHFLNTSSVMDFILGLIRPFLKKELMDILYLHPNVDSLAKHMSVDILPDEVGGKAGKMMDLYAKVIKDIEKHRDYFIEEERLVRVDESKRLGKPKTATELFGVEGSFKKLDID